MLLYTRHYQYKQAVVKDWADHRDLLSDAMLRSALPPSKCTLCDEEANMLCVCEDCGPHYAECLACVKEKQTHMYRPLHFRKLWNVSHNIIL